MFLKLTRVYGSDGYTGTSSREELMFFNIMNIGYIETCRNNSSYAMGIRANVGMRNGSGSFPVKETMEEIQKLLKERKLCIE